MSNGFYLFARRRAAAGLILALAGLLCRSPESGAAETSPAGDGSPPRDALVFQSGDILYGTIRAAEPQTLHWMRDDVLEPMEFLPGAISEILLQARRQPEFSPANACHVFLANRDQIEGDLISADGEKLILHTWYAGTLEIPRKMVRTIAPIPSARSMIYSGPTVSLDGWTIGKVNTLEDAGEWKYHDGAFYATRSASIARDLNLPDIARIQFDLAWKGSVATAIALYTDSLQPIALQNKHLEPDFGGFYSLIIFNSYCSMRAITKADPIRDFGNEPVPALQQTNSARIEILVSKPKRLIALVVNGELVKQWIDPEGFIGEGTGVRFVHQGAQAGGGSVRLGNIRVTEWNEQFDGKVQPSTGELADDVAGLQNGDRVAGTIESIQDGKLRIVLDGGAPMEIPLVRVRQIDFAGERPSGSLRSRADVRAHFVRGGYITLSLEQWDERGLTASSALFGKATFDPAAFGRIEFLKPDSLQ